MKLLRYPLFFIFFLCFGSTSLSANEQISFVDVDKLMKQTILGKKIIQNLNQLNKKNIILLKSKEDEIKDLETNINKQKNIISEEELRSKIKSLQNEVSTFRKEKEKLINEFNIKKNQELSNFFKKASPLIQDYIKNKDISIVLDKKNIFIGNQDNDITNDIIILLDSKLR